MKIKTMKRKIKVLEHAFAASAGAYYNINLTRDIIPGTMYQVINDQEYSINEQIGMPENACFTDVVKYWSTQVPEDLKKDYFETMNTDNLLARFAKGESHVWVRYWTKTALFEPMFAEQHVVMYPDEETGDVLAITYVIDLTNEYKEKQYKEKLEKSHAELKQALQAAKDANFAKSMFLSNMSHDIRTPMNAIVGITKLMEHDKNDPEKLEAYIHKVQTSSQHLLSLINDVLDMSKIESGEVKLNRESISIAEQVGQVDSIIRPQIEERNQNFTIRVHEIAHEYLIGDAVRLRQIYINLLSNAVKYTQGGGTIHMDIAELSCHDEEHALIRTTVADNGCGMTKELMENIFEPFTRAENSTTNKVQGTGLGMAITKNIVDLMGGTITVQSEPNKGSCFEVTLPLLIEKKVKYEIDAWGVLLIATEEMLIKNVSASFRESGIPLYIARSKEEAKVMLAKEYIDTILLSGHIYDRNLNDIVAQLREQAHRAVMVFCVDYELCDNAGYIFKESGADGLIARPFFLSNFAVVVNEVRSDATPKKEEKQSLLKGMKFLCAEDNALNAEILNALMDMQGATCVIYPDGKKLVDAFKSVRPGDFDAILMDVQMPILNGLDATRAIRDSENPLGKTIPIIAMTANAFSSDVQDCLDAGMDAHVAKPLEISDLERALKSTEDFSGGGHLFAHKRKLK